MLRNQSLTGSEAICAGSYATLAATSQIMAAMRAYKGRVAPLEVLAQLTFLHSKPPTHMPKLKMVNQRPCPIAMMNNIASIEGNALVTPLAEPPPEPPPMLHALTMDCPVEVSPVDPVKAPLDPEVPLAEPPPMPHAV